MGFSVSTLKSLKENEFAGCYLQEKYLEDPSEQVIFFLMDFVNKQ